MAEATGGTETQGPDAADRHVLSQPFSRVHSACFSALVLHTLHDMIRLQATTCILLGEKIKREQRRPTWGWFEDREARFARDAR